MFFKRSKKALPIDYDRENEEPVLRCSICTGEKTAGFRDLKSGRFREYMLVRDGEELREFCTGCGVEDIKRIY